MAEAHTELTEAMGSPGAWKWSRIHTATFENQTLGQSGIGPIEWVFNHSAPKRLGGGADIVNAVGYFPPDGYVVELGSRRCGWSSTSQTLPHPPWAMPPGNQATPSTPITTIRSVTGVTDNSNRCDGPGSRWRRYAVATLSMTPHS